MERRARETRERAKMERRAGRRAVGKRAEREQERGCDDDGSSAQRPGPGAWAAGLRLCGQIEYASYQARPQRPNSKAATASWRPACCCVRAWMLERSHHTPTSALREPQCTCPSPRPPSGDPHTTAKLGGKLPRYRPALHTFPDDFTFAIMLSAYRVPACLPFCLPVTRLRTNRNIEP